MVGNEDKERKFYINNLTNKGTHTFKQIKDRTEIVVTCQNITDIITSHKVNKIKIDVKGAEYELLLFNSCKDTFNN